MTIKEMDSAAEPELDFRRKAPPGSVRPSIRFKDGDTYQGVNSDPISLHKYLYANANPISGIDPTGRYTTTELAITGGIIGGIVGFTAGTYIGYQKTGRLLSWETLGYGLLGLAAGAAIGAFIGAGIGVILNGAVPFNALTSIAKMSSKLIQTVAAGKLYRVTPVVFLAGVLAGATTEYLAPDRFHEPIGIGSLLALPANSLALLIYDSVVTRVPGAIQESIVFVAGFNVGYFGAKNLGQLPDAIRRIPDLLD